MTLDGPSGSGKTSLASDLAAALCGVALHTGRHYRAVTLACLHAAVPMSEATVVDFLDSSMPSLDAEGRLLLEGRVFSTSELEASGIDALVSRISNMNEIRERLITLQKAWVAGMTAQGLPVVIEGRDAGTRIAPDARLRVLLHASATERASRRSSQREGGGSEPSAVLAEIKRRDEADRGHGRTTPDTPGITELETDGLSRAQVLAALWTYLSPVAGQSPPPQGHIPKEPCHNRG